MRGRFYALLSLLVCGAIGCAPHAPESLRDTLGLSSTSFVAGRDIPIKFTCNGANVSPELSWNAPPSNTRSLALVVTDRDSPLQFAIGPFVHWIVYDIPARSRQLQENLSTSRGGMREGTNGFDKAAYGGPCPPGSGIHRYAFVVYALDSQVNLPPDASVKALYEAIEGHVVAQGTLVGHYH